MAAEVIDYLAGSLPQVPSEIREYITGLQIF